MELKPDQTARLRDLQRATFRYFWDLADPRTGLVPDSSKRDAPSSIAAVGMALASFAVGAEAGWVSRPEAAERVRITLRTFWRGPGDHELDAIGHRGFFYHFLDMESGRRAWRSELSTIDTAILLAGGLTAGRYFDGDDEVESEIRELADALYRRTDWRWALDRGATVSHGWKPEGGFLRYRWEGYNEALLLYALALGSPTYPIPASSYRAYTKAYDWKKLYGHELVYAGPLFIHQLPHIWIDLRGIQDAYMREKGIDYFENSRRATLIQQQYAVRNPRGFNAYGPFVWGITASDGPGPAVRSIDGHQRRFWDYRARGVPWGPDDGTLSPWAVAASLPFAPELVARTLEEIDERYPELSSELGYKCSFNPTFPAKRSNGWISRGYYGLDQGPVVLMIENFRTGMIWNLMRDCPYLEAGLRRAGFSGGWLDRPR